MLTRYVKVLKGNIFLLVVVIALIIVSTITKGNVSKVTSIMAGVLLILIALRGIIWLIRTPVKSKKDEDV